MLRGWATAEQIADPETSLPALYLDSSLTACSGVESTAAPQKLLILDARSYTAAVANRAKGGGCECEGIVITQCHSHSGVWGSFGQEGVEGSLSV